MTIILSVSRLPHARGSLVSGGRHAHQPKGSKISLRLVGTGATKKYDEYDLIRDAVMEVERNYLRR